MNTDRFPPWLNTFFSVQEFWIFCPLFIIITGYRKCLERSRASRKRLWGVASFRITKVSYMFYEQSRAINYLPKLNLKCRKYSRFLMSFHSEQNRFNTKLLSCFWWIISNFRGDTIVQYRTGFCCGSCWKWCDSQSFAVGLWEHSYVTASSSSWALILVGCTCVLVYMLAWLQSPTCLATAPGSNYTLLKTAYSTPKFGFLNRILLYRVDVIQYLFVATD